MLYALAKAPEEVAVPIIARIERGEPVSPRFVTVTVAEHKQKNASVNYEPDASPPEPPWPAITRRFPSAEPEQPADDERETPEPIAEGESPAAKRPLPDAVRKQLVAIVNGSVNWTTARNFSEDERRLLLEALTKVHERVEHAIEVLQSMVDFESGGG